jgi:hypothetical protein
MAIMVPQECLTRGCMKCHCQVRTLVVTTKAVLHGKHRSLPVLLILHWVAPTLEHSQDHCQDYTSHTCVLKVATSEGILQREVLSDHPEASQGDLEIKQSCESWQESRPTYKPCEPGQKSG